MKKHVLSVHHMVEDLEGATAFCQDFLSLQRLDAGADFAVFDNGSVRIRLTKTDGPQSPGTLILDLPTRKIEQDEVTFRAEPALKQLKELHKLHPQRAESHFQGPHGFQLILSRTYNEDEIGLIPELQMSLCWEERAEHFMRQSLRLVPVVFRDLARKRCTEKAEVLAVEKGEIEVDYDISVRAFIREAPFFMRNVMREELEKTGMDMSPFEEEFTTAEDESTTSP